MSAMPTPSVRYNRCEIRSFCHPAKQLACFLRVGDQDGRVAGSPRFIVRGYLAICDPLNHIDHLPHGGALTVSEIDGDRLALIQKMFKGQNVRPAQIADVNVVADRGTIWRRVIRSEDGHVRSSA